MENENNSKLDALAKMRSQTGKRHQETKEKTSKKDDSDEVCRCSI